MVGWTAFCWFVGAVLWGAALLQPILLGFVTDAQRSTAERTVNEIVRSQATRFDSGQNSYVLFGASLGEMGQGFAQLNLQAPGADSDFLYETVQVAGEGGKERVVVRARPTPAAIKKGLFPLPPMVYEYDLTANTGGAWNSHGRTKPKLYGLF